jgi:hypothetical protein
MREPGSGRPLVALAAAFLAGALACGLALSLGRGRASSPAAAPPGAVTLVGGIPVGVLHSPAGALAAADNYVALASQSVEQDPRTFEELVTQAYAPQARAGALSEARRIRAADTQSMANYAEGGRALAVVAARRLDAYSPTSATVTTWLGGFVWGPRLTPRQSWNLVDTRLAWQHGRWLVVSSSTDATAAPVPSIVYVRGDNNAAAAFSALAGMSAPFYGAAG